MEYDFTSIDMSPTVSVMYQDINEDFKINRLDTSYFDLPITVKGVLTTRCPLLKSVWDYILHYE